MFPAPPRASGPAKSGPDVPGAAPHQCDRGHPARHVSRAPRRHARCSAARGARPGSGRPGTAEATPVCWCSSRFSARKGAGPPELPENTLHMRGPDDLPGYGREAQAGQRGPGHGLADAHGGTGAAAWLYHNDVASGGLSGNDAHPHGAGGPCLPVCDRGDHAAAGGPGRCRPAQTAGRRRRGAVAGREVACATPIGSHAAQCTVPDLEHGSPGGARVCVLDRGGTVVQHRRRGHRKFADLRDGAYRLPRSARTEQRPRPLPADRRRPERADHSEHADGRRLRCRAGGNLYIRDAHIRAQGRIRRAPADAGARFRAPDRGRCRQSPHRLSVHRLA